MENLPKLDARVRPYQDPSDRPTKLMAFAELMIGLTGQTAPSELATQLRRQADRIAENREVAGVHFQIDSDEGKRLGAFLATQLLALTPTQAPM